MTTTTSYAKPETSGRKIRVSSSIVVWLFLVAYLVLVKSVILPLLPPIEIDAVAANFTWDKIIIFSFIGLVGVWLADHTGFRPALDPRLSNRQRFLIPLLVGGGLGALAILLDLITNGTQFIAENMGESSYNTDFLTSLFVYTSGTVMVEALFRLFLFPALLGLISYVLLKKRWQEQIYWMLVIPLSLLEALGQLSGQLTANVMENFGPFFLAIFLPMLATNYPMAVAQAYFFRMYGFLASFTLRMGYYIIWHILYGSLIFPLLNG